MPVPSLLTVMALFLPALPAALLVLLLLAIITGFFPIGLWISARAAGVKVGLPALIGLRLRRIAPARVVLPLIKARQAGLPVTGAELEAHLIAGGDADEVVDAMVTAQRAHIDLPFAKAAALTLAGWHIKEAVRMCLLPKVIEIPFVSAFAKDGVELKVKAKVTVRAVLDRLSGGDAGEAAIVARVEEGLVAAIGAASSHQAVLEDPGLFSAAVLEKDLATNTAFEILSIAITAVDIGRHAGAKLESEQAEAEVLRALAWALRRGRLGVRCCRHAPGAAYPGEAGEDPYEAGTDRFAGEEIGPDI